MIKITDKEIQTRREEMRGDLVELRAKAGMYGYIIRYGRSKTRELGFYIINKEEGKERKAQSIRGLEIEIENIEKEAGHEGVCQNLLCLDCGEGMWGNSKVECPYCGSDRVMVEECNISDIEDRGYYSPYADSLTEREVGNYKSDNHE